jgi:predicted homoserine dehydrogenase-like protein
MTYGLCENHATVRSEGLLPIGLAEGCRLRRDIRRDQVIARDDVDIPSGRLCDRLREEQDRVLG